MCPEHDHTRMFAVRWFWFDVAGRRPEKRGLSPKLCLPDHDRRVCSKPPPHTCSYVSHASLTRLSRVTHALTFVRWCSLLMCRRCRLALQTCRLADVQMFRCSDVHHRFELNRSHSVQRTMGFFASRHRQVPTTNLKLSPPPHPPPDSPHRCPPTRCLFIVAS